MREVWKFCQFSTGECALTTYRCEPPGASAPTDTARFDLDGAAVLVLQADHGAAGLAVATDGAARA